MFGHTWHPGSQQQNHGQQTGAWQNQQTSPDQSLVRDSTQQAFQFGQGQHNYHPSQHDIHQQAHLYDAGHVASEASLLHGTATSASLQNSGPPFNSHGHSQPYDQPDNTFTGMSSSQLPPRGPNEYPHLSTGLTHIQSDYSLHPQTHEHPRSARPAFHYQQHPVPHAAGPFSAPPGITSTWTQTQLQQQSPSVDDLSQWSGPSHSSSRDEMWQSPSTRDVPRQSGFRQPDEPVSGFVGPSNPADPWSDHKDNTSHRSSLADAQDFSGPSKSRLDRESIHSAQPWLQAFSSDSLNSGMGEAGNGRHPSLPAKSPTSSHTRQSLAQKSLSSHLQMPNGSADERLMVRNDSPLSYSHGAMSGSHAQASIPGSVFDPPSASGSFNSSASHQAADGLLMYNAFDTSIPNAATGSHVDQHQLSFSDFEHLQSALNVGAPVGGRPASSNSCNPASHSSTAIPTAEMPEHFGTGTMATSQPSFDASQSTLSNAFGPSHPGAGKTPLRSHNQKIQASSLVPSGSDVTGQAIARQRSSTLGSPAAPLGSAQRDDLDALSSTQPPFGRSNSSDATMRASEGEPSLRSAIGQRATQQHPPDFSSVPQKPGQLQQQRASQGPHLIVGSAGSNFVPGSGYGVGSVRSDGDPARLSTAMAGAQLGSTTQDVHGSTPTIIEEDEDQNGHGGPRLGFGGTSHFVGGSQLPREMVGLPGHRLPKQESPKAVPKDDLARRQYENEILMQMEQTGPQDARPDPYTDLASANTSQIKMQDHPPQPSSTAPIVLRRRYKPTVRPATYQQLAMMNLGKDEVQNSMTGIPGTAPNSDDFIDEIIRHYITCPSRLGLGERTVLIMTSKVAQKSYGAEKRFLSPPPMVLLIGSSWWNSCQHSPGLDMQGLHGPQYGNEPPTVLTPPRVNIGMSGETNNQDGVLEWATSTGRLIDVGNPSSEMAVSGRCIGKQLYISDIDEKRRTCEMLVSLSVPGLSATDARLLGTFASKPIKIISKPSKKRQSNRNTELGILHGSIVSLFHRLRSQTVSTRYLCVSGAPTWFKGSDGQPFLTVDQTNSKPRPSDSPSCFVAKMTSWDPFVVYLVDPKKDPNDPNAPPMKPPLPGYPPPPPSAMAVPSAGQSQMTVHYNQRIVLQCLNTAVVSPIMVVRKVEKAATVVGGAAASGAGEGSATEALGDPVSQLHKIALEVVEDPSAPAPSATEDRDASSSSPGMGGPFLACLNESVGMRRPPEGRKWAWNQPSATSTPATPMTPDTLPQEAFGQFRPGPPPQSPTNLAAAYAAAQTRTSLSQTRMSLGGSSRPVSSGSTGSGSAAAPYPSVSHPQQRPPSSDGGKVRRPRRVSSSIVTQRERVNTAGSGGGQAGGAGGVTFGLAGSVPGAPVPSASGKSRRRGQSLSVVEWQREQARQHIAGEVEGQAPTGTASETTLGGTPLSAAWSVDIADSDIWTIVGTDIARHTFYIPPRLAGGVTPATNVPDSGIAHLITTPAPSAPITPVPSLHSFVPPNPSDAQPCVTLCGLNFTQDLLVYFGDWRSTQVEAQSPETLLCTPPPPASEAFEVPNVRLPIILVRKDGVIFPTDCIYST